VLEVIFDIKLCLGVVFLIGLITGHYYIKATMTKDYGPILKNLIRQTTANRTKVKENIIHQESLSRDIASMRDSISEYTDSIPLLESNLLDIEHIYSKSLDSNRVLQKELDDSNKVLKSYSKELNSYKNILRGDYTIDKNILTQNEINKLKVDIDHAQKSIEDIKSKEYLLIQKRDSLSEESTKQNRLVSNIKSQISKKTNELIQEDPVYKMELKVKNLNKEFERLKTYLKSLV
jgi:chromosome segregation ATPase